MSGAARAAPPDTLAAVMLDAASMLEEASKEGDSAFDPHEAGSLALQLRQFAPAAESESAKLREERDAADAEIATLRASFVAAEQERDRLRERVGALAEEADRQAAVPCPEKELTGVVRDLAGPWAWSRMADLLRAALRAESGEAATRHHKVLSCSLCGWTAEPCSHIGSWIERRGPVNEREQQSGGAWSGTDDSQRGRQGSSRSATATPTTPRADSLKMLLTDIEWDAAHLYSATGDTRALGIHAVAHNALALFDSHDCTPATPAPTTPPDDSLRWYKESPEEVLRKAVAEAKPPATATGHCSACGPVPSDHHHCSECDKPIRDGEVWVTEVVNGWPWTKHRDCRDRAPATAPAEEMPTCDAKGPHGEECDRDPGHGGAHRGWDAMAMLRRDWAEAQPPATTREPTKEQS